MNSSNNGFLHSRRFRYGGVAVILTCVIIAAVILFNALFSLLATKFLWYTDMTTESLYTLSPAAIKLLEDVDSKGQDVKIIFCDEPDNLRAEFVQRLIYQTALEIEEKNDYVKVENINIWRNPTAVNKYKTNSKSRITSQTVIIESGTEFRVYTLRAFYSFDSADTTTPVAYRGEKTIVSGILAVTQAESPIVCVTYNHGEPFVTEAELAETSEILTMLSNAGYDVQLIDLANSEIPEKCRMLFIYDPSDDFLVKDGISDKSEIEKIDRFLDGTNALAVFMDPATPRLPNLEEYLDEWGISFMRSENVGNGMLESCVIKDDAHSLTTDGLSIVGEYTAEGLGASIHKDLRTQYPPKVIFKNVMPIAYSDRYQLTLDHNEEEQTTVNDYTYGSFFRDGVSRAIYDVFLSSVGSEAMAGGRLIGTATEAEKYKLMTVSRETRMVTNTDADYSYVLACGSTEFLSPKMLQSNVYGNEDVMLSAMRAMGKEFVPVGLEAKMFVSTSIESITTAEANRYTALLTVIPAVIVFGIGVYVLVRRKYA